MQSLRGAAANGNADCRSRVGVEWLVAGKKRRVLFVQYTANFSLSTIGGKILIEGLVVDGWEVPALFSLRGQYLTG